jgi:O-antigen ligase
MKSIVTFCILISLALTPWYNVDSLVIPKLVLILALASYLVPLVLISIKSSFKNKHFRYLYLVSFLFLIQLSIVFVVSDAPWEQQFFGRTGRGLGLLAYFSFIVILVATALSVNLRSIGLIGLGLTLSCGISSLYCIFQYFGLDIFNWVTATNGIIGTLGNPNFQSSFIAASSVPILIYIWQKKARMLILVPISLILVGALYLCESTQGYIALGISFFTFLLFYLYYKSKKLFIGLFFIFLGTGILIILGMLNKGPFSNYLYKVSVQSRGEMWRSAFTGANANPFFGVGLDSFGDWSLFYRDQQAARGIAEFTDNAHNIFLQLAVTGGYLLTLMYFLVILLTLVSIFLVQKRLQKFDPMISALVAAWISLQAQSIISPAGIPILAWQFVISGAIIGLSQNMENYVTKLKSKSDIPNVFSFSLLIFSLFVSIPYVQSDALSMKSLNAGDAVLAIRAAKAYPESTVRYARIGGELLKSNLPKESLEVGRAAVSFNPNAISGWILILANVEAPLPERKKAKLEILRLDPFNKIVAEFKL